MKTLFTALIALSLPALMVANNGDDKTVYTVNPSESKVAWKGYKVTGEHEGTINLTAGTIEMDGDKLVGGEFTIDMTSITVTDLSGESKGKLEGHLKSDDFFGVESHETATLTVTKAKSKSDGYHVTGDLTIKGITKPVEFVVVMSTENENMVGRAKVTVDRSKYDVRYGSNSFFDNLGDKAIYDNFDLNIELAFNEASS